MAHLDLKPDNYMFRHDMKLALIDFGHAYRVDKRCLKEYGTNEFRAPEMQAVISYGSTAKYSPRQADLFSLGATLLSLVTIKFPFSGNVLEDNNY